MQYSSGEIEALLAPDSSGESYVYQGFVFLLIIGSSVLIRQ